MASSEEIPNMERLKEQCMHIYRRFFTAILFNFTLEYTIK